MNLADNKPSIAPPGPIIFATPFLRHLARPSEADKTERCLRKIVQEGDIALSWYIEEGEGEKNLN